MTADGGEWNARLYPGQAVQDAEGPGIGGGGLIQVQVRTTDDQRCVDRGVGGRVRVVQLELIEICGCIGVSARVRELTTCEARQTERPDGDEGEQHSPVHCRVSVESDFIQLMPYVAGF